MTRASRRRDAGTVWVPLVPAEIATLISHHRALAEELWRAGQYQAADQLEERLAVLELLLAGVRLP